MVAGRSLRVPLSEEAVHHIRMKSRIGRARIRKREICVLLAVYEAEMHFPGCTCFHLEGGIPNMACCGEDHCRYICTIRLVSHQTPFTTSICFCDLPISGYCPGRYSCNTYNCTIDYCLTACTLYSRRQAMLLYGGFEYRIYMDTCLRKSGSAVAKTFLPIIAEARLPKPQLTFGRRSQYGPEDYP